MRNTSERLANSRQGRFLWMPESSRRDYLASLRRKIEEGYFFSEPILSRLAEDLAPAYSDSINADIP